MRQEMYFHGIKKYEDYSFEELLDYIRISEFDLKAIPIEVYPYIMNSPNIRKCIGQWDNAFELNNWIRNRVDYFEWSNERFYELSEVLVRSLIDSIEVILNAIMFEGLDDAYKRFIYDDNAVYEHDGVITLLGNHEKREEIHKRLFEVKFALEDMLKKYSFDDYHIFFSVETIK